MLLSKIFTGAIMAAMSVPALAVATPEQIAPGINAITEKSRGLLSPAQSITTDNAPLIVYGQGPLPQLISGFKDIISTATSLVGQLGVVSARARSLSTKDRRQVGVAGYVADAFRGFVQVHQNLLNILIGKAGLLEHVPGVGPSVAAVLHDVEAIVHTLAIALINTFESVATDLQGEANSLNAALDLAIQKYEALPVQ